MNSSDDCQHKIYCFLHKGAPKFQDDLNDSKHFTNDYQNYILYAINTVSQNYIQINRGNYTISVSDIEKLVKNLKSLISFDESEQESEQDSKKTITCLKNNPLFDHFSSAITSLIEHNKKLDTIFIQNPNITTDTENLYSEINDNIKLLKNGSCQCQITDILNKMMDGIHSIIKAIKQIIKFTIALMNSQNKIFVLIRNIINLMKALYQHDQTKYPYADLLSLKSFLFEQEMPIAVFSKDSSNETKPDFKKENINQFTQISHNILNGYCELINGIMQNSNNDVRKFFEDIVLKFKSNLSECLKSNEPFPLFSQLYSGPQIYYDDLFYELDFSLINLFDIGKGNFKQKGEILFENITNISDIKISKFYDELRTILFQNNSEAYLELLKNTIIGIIIHIYQQSSIDKRSFSEIFKNFFQKDIFDVRLGEANTRYNISSDDNLNIYHKRCYICSDNNLFAKEIELLESNISKFITHSYKKDESNTIYLPYYSRGTLFSLYHLSSNSKLTNADKIVIIYEIAQALKDLHSKGESHGNFTDRNIFIDHANDAFIGSFHYDENIEKDPSITNFHFYFRPPEYIVNKEKGISTEQNKEEQQLSDIYAFGIIMHEILTDTLPESRMEKLPLQERKTILKKEYCNFLLKGENNEILNDPNNEDLRSIISNCMNNDINNRFQTMEKVIDSLEKSKLYKECKEYVENRTSKFNTDNYSKCNLIDLFEGYFIDNQNYYEDIARLFSFYFTKCSDYEDLISKIVQFLDSSNTSTNKSTIFDQLDRLSQLCPKSEYSQLSIKKKIILMFDEIQKKEEFFYFKSVFRIFLDYYLDDFGLIDNEELKYQQICENAQLNFDNSMNAVFADQNINFFNRKTYKSEEAKVEISQPKSECSPHIVQITESDDKTSIYLPYFPFGTLEEFLENESHPSLTYADKFNIIMDIGTALSNLHSSGRYHCNLSDKFVFINSKLNAFISVYYHDKSQEGLQTIFDSHFYFECPSCYFNDNMTNDEKGRLSDIYSFGILMFEIFTEKSISSMIKGKTRQEKVELSNYKSFADFLLSECKLNDLQNIIKKCIIRNDESFNSINNAINGITSLTLYTNNEKEINFRLSQVTNSSENQLCSLKDLIECNYCGKKNSFDIIQKAFSKLNLKKIHIIDDLFACKDKQLISSDKLEEIFSLLIESYRKFKIGENKLIDLNNRLLILSYHVNETKKIPVLETKKIPVLETKSIFTLNTSYKNDNYIVPISNLTNFCDKYSNMVPSCTLRLLYMIAFEINFIHSLDLFIGNLSMNSIGVYRNNKTGHFNASFILYYLIFNAKNSCCKCIHSKDCNCNYCRNHTLEERKKKDIKNFLKIAEKMNFQGDIYESDSMNDIIFNLSRSQNNNDQEEEISNLNKDDYSSYEITFSSLKNLFKDLYSKEKDLLQNLFINVEFILTLFQEVLDNQDKKISEILGQMYEKGPNEFINIDNIIPLFTKIGKTKLINDQIENNNDEDNQKVDEDNQKVDENHHIKFHLSPLTVKNYTNLRQVDNEKAIFPPYYDNVLKYKLDSYSMISYIPNYINRLDSDKRYQVIFELDDKINVNQNDIDALKKRLPKRVDDIFIGLGEKIHVHVDKDNNSDSLRL